MPVQVGKMILHGILHAVLYIALPLILFEVIGMLGFMTFSQGFKISIMIIGAIGVFFTMLRHAYPKDTSANRIMAFIATIYSGFYLFYLFGGFTPGAQLGTYSIILPTIQILLGLQVFAWLLLGSSAIRALQYLIEAIELRKMKEFKVRKQFKLSKMFKVLGILLSLVIMGYLGTIAYSASQIRFNMHDTIDFGWDDGGTLTNATDDAINITLTFDVQNGAIYAIYEVYLDMDIYTNTTDNPVILPENTKIGESKNNYYGVFHSSTTTLNQKITVNIDPAYAPGLATTNAMLDLRIAFSTLYAAININLNISAQTQWNALI